MNFKFAPATLVVTALSGALVASAAHAGCGSRPGTPNEVKAEALSATSIRFSWRNTTGKGMNKSGSTSQGDTPHRMWFDISVRGGIANQFGNMTGIGPFSVTYGSRSHRDFPNLATPQTLCFKIRARDAGGTKGCVSESFSNEVCATTVAAAPSRPPVPSSKVLKLLLKPQISVSREEGNVFVVVGAHLKPNFPVTIRVVDNATLTGVWITTVGGQRIVASAQGRLTIRLFNLCTQARGALSFTANGGTGWTNAATVACLR